MNKKIPIISLILLILLVSAIVSAVIRVQKSVEIKTGLGAIPGDVNSDGVVDIIDFQLLSNSFGKTSGQSGYNINADFNHDNVVDILDFQVLSNNFGNTGTTNTPTPRVTATTTPRPSVTTTPYPTVPGSANSYYVSPNGSDNNFGTASQPFKTFTKAFSVLSPGNTLYLYGGTYTEQLNVSKSGTSSSPIFIKPVTGQNAVLDAGYQRDAPLNVGSNYINITGLSVTRGTFDCVLVSGSNVVLNGLDVYDCRKFGIRLKGSVITVENSQCRDSVTENQGGGNTSGGWGSCLRSGPGSQNLTMRNNRVFRNWGEGIIVGQAAGAKVYGNTVNDNFSVNIYIGNTYDVDVYKNMTYSTDSRYFRSGSPANCIAASEESIPNWGAQLHNIRVYNNIAYSCKTGVGYTYAEVSGNGCQNCLFAYNTLVNTQGIKVIDGTKNSVTVKNNIINGGSINVPSNSVVSNNLLTDPKFASTPGTNPTTFRLSSSSPAINAGVSISGITDDFEGKLRNTSTSPGVDIGAIEYAQ